MSVLCQSGAKYQNTVDNYKSTQHVFKKRKLKENPNVIVCVDTESYIRQIIKEKRLTLKIACIIFYNKKTNKTTEKTYYDALEFWNDLLKLFDSNNHKIQHVHLFAHNSQHDFDQLDGWRILKNLGWNITFKAIKNAMFILELEKFEKKGILELKKDGLKFRLHIWDTMNYVKLPLKTIGKALGFPKGEIDFDKYTDEALDKCIEKELLIRKKELEEYCMQDTKIVFLFVLELIKLLEKYNLTELRMTAPSMALNCFRINHYFPDKDDENSVIVIHSWKEAIKWEREAYRGGIVDVFQYGETDEILYKLDFNSQYPFVMRNCLLPIRLVGTFYESKWSQEFLFKYYDYWKKRGYLFILNCSIQLREEGAYVINREFNGYDFGKNVFFHTEGNDTVDITLCNPELDHVERYGKITRIYSLAIYKGGYLFRKYVDFFYALKLKFKAEGNKVGEQIAKLFLNSFYGKWGQTKIITENFNKGTNFELHKEIASDIWKKIRKIIVERNLTLETIKTETIYVDIINGIEFWLINGEVEYSIKTEENSYDSFVAIPAFITSNARMMLIRAIKIAERPNCFYSDTDSLLVNEEGYQNILKFGLIETEAHELGYLKVEGSSEKGEISRFWNKKKYELYWKYFEKNNEDYNPKHFTGLKKDAYITEENDKFVRAEQEKWMKHKTKRKKGIYGVQIINIVEIEFSKEYNNGKVDSEGFVHPFSSREIIALCKKKKK